MLKNIFVTSLLFAMISGCAHSPRCGNPEGAKIIFEGQNTCTVRIRQVIVGNELKIPDSLKNPELVNLKLEWVDPNMKDGIIISGHFILVPTILKTDGNASTSKVLP